MNFGHVLTAMVTPFNQNGAVDLDKTDQLINYLISHGSDALVVGGTTGESPTLSIDEKETLFQHTVQSVNRRVPVIAGTGSNNTHASIELTKKAEAAGVDAVMLVVPYYNKPTQEGLYQHFKAIAESTNLPVMLYNIPGRSVINMEPETVVRLSEIENIVSIKDASGDLDAMAEIIERTPGDFSVYSGEDGLTLPSISIGADGIVSVSAHVLGEDMQRMIEAFRSGDVFYASRIHRKLLPKMQAIFSAPSPAPVKAALNRRGIDVGGVRLPLLPLTNEEANELETVLNADVVGVK
ncbi:4-hydroxy-tetrahydrodipicolinate synthase [Halobacillus litoralis]|uniref:4-hydroxy-tetrahydrodipicolinate synthase n=1 Tax=Halobacillus litoralis TaxID=45668 RepID=UPI001CD2D97D|nr:4-hydroxy-tetrahydrodipicolinate synthase [Halobacillus litoralis]MCA0971482.1 4-hydroxy-tetrahydrodipicolinate synthase [Halobacillus litoralis]